MSEPSSLLDQILSGENRQLQLLAASGTVPLPLDELIPLQVALAGSPDAEIADAARQSLAALEPRVVAAFVAEPAGEAELRHFARHSRQPEVLEALLRRRDVPRSIFVELAPHLAPDLQEVLVLRQDAILEEPRILVALEENPALSSYARRRIWEYREHLLPRDKVPPKSAEAIVSEADGLTDGEVQEAIEEARGTHGEGQVDDGSGLNEGQIRSLPVPVRIRLARGASRQLRSILIRDQNAQVALSVMRANQLGDQEVEQIARSRSVLDEVLAEVTRRREWVRKYAIVKALVTNPRTHASTAVRLLPQLTVRDLRDLGRDRNVSQAVRSTAARLYQARR